MDTPVASTLPLLCSRRFSWLSKSKKTSLSASPLPSLSTHTSGDTQVQAHHFESISYSVFGKWCQRVTITSGAGAAEETVRVKLPDVSQPETTTITFASLTPPRSFVMRLVYELRSLL